MDLPITAVSTRAFCPRQAYLQHAEAARADNRYTVEGRALHAALPTDLTHNVHLAHEALGLVGVADAIEPGPVPIEHKRGDAIDQRPQHIQLALYALCLEEMLGQPVPRGLIAHGLTRRREEVAIDAALRADALRELAALHPKDGPPTRLPHHAQHRAAEGPAALEIARSCVLGKLANSRAVLRRGAREARDPELAATLHAAADALQAQLLPVRSADDADTLRGLEGQGAALYFGALGGLFKGELSFTTRNRRPPRDEANAAMSFLYALLCSDCATAAQVVGLDPQLGFFHVERSGRPSLALDLMEELRPLADRVLLAMVNRRQLRAEHFEREEPGAILLSAAGRRIVLEAWSAHRKVELRHPFLEIDVTYGLLPQLQARLLARHLRGDVDAYVPFILPG